ncbi:DUF3168 domain-containing protein [uncultured Maricaulis sp.]|uniref:tail completion protein gp17 n=1 Tax=uncultured Maricaulis sp. TaxID=174710 RepID=UPI0030D83171|tara:strand:- start:130877 stop:131302 length:426 start_codon:yes stop_codon:yes gene_type:complete
MAEDVDIIGAVLALLKADAPVAAVVGARVFGSELPKDEAASMPRPAIVVKPSGGLSNAQGSDVQHDTQRFDLVAYGATPNGADALRTKCRRALTDCKRRVIEGALIHWIGVAGGFSAGRDRHAGWPYAFQSFQIYFALKEV